MRTSIPFILLPLVVGCSAADFGVMADEDWGDSGGWNAAPEDEGDTDLDDDPGSETEDDFRLLSPATTDAYVFVANPERNTLSRISVPGLEVITVEVGSQPSVVATTADYMKAVCFNPGSDDVSVVDAESLTVENVAVRSNLNALVLSPDGVWAVVFHDADVVDEDLDDLGGSRSFNEITVVNTETLEAFDTVVGQRPHQVKFTQAADRALVVSDDALAVITLDSATFDVDFIELSTDYLDPPRAEEVEITPSGEFALVRLYGSSDIIVVNLWSGEVGSVSVDPNPMDGLAGNPTDMDLTPDGSLAVVVVRDYNQLHLLDTSNPTLRPQVLNIDSEQATGSLVFTADGSRGLLYTNATPSDRFTIWDAATNEFQTKLLVKPVESMSISPSGDALLVFHTKEDMPDADPDGLYYGAWALTLMDLSDFRTNPLKLAAEPTEYAHSDDGAYGFFIMEGASFLEVVDYASLIPEGISLKSVPEHVGVLPDTSYAYVSQEHSLGRISFYDTEEGSLETITGFELNSEIEH